MDRLQTCFPISQLPVKETRGILTSVVIASPISFPPAQSVHTAPGMPFSSSTLAIIFEVATEVKEVVGAPFQSRELPHT